MPETDELYYQKLLFRTRLLGDRLYTASHFWVQEQERGLWRVGLTKFASRMLGDVVEIGFEVSEGMELRLGQTIGWFEGFKASSELYCVVSGVFAGSNPELTERIALIDDDRYRRGWLYAVRGLPDPGAMDMHAYAELLDRTIERMRQAQIEAGE